MYEFSRRLATTPSTTNGGDLIRKKAAEQVETRHSACYQRDIFYADDFIVTSQANLQFSNHNYSSNYNLNIISPHNHSS